MSTTDQFWFGVTADVDAEHEERRLTQARVASASTWAFLAEATSPQEFDDRLALAEDRLHKSITAVVGDDPAAFAEVYPRLVESFQSDFDLLVESRREAALARSRKERLRRTKDPVTRARRAQGQRRRATDEGFIKWLEDNGWSTDPEDHEAGGSHNGKFWTAWEVLRAQYEGKEMGSAGLNHDGRWLAFPKEGQRRTAAEGEPEFIQMCRRILQNRQYEEWDGVDIDMQTANVVTMVYDAMSAPDKAEKFEKIGPAAFVDFAWSRVSSSRQAGHYIGDEAGSLAIGDSMADYVRVDNSNSEWVRIDITHPDGMEEEASEHAGTSNSDSQSDFVERYIWERFGQSPMEGTATIEWYDDAHFVVDLAPGKQGSKRKQEGSRHPFGRSPGGSREAAFGDQWEDTGNGDQALRHGPLIAEVTAEGWVNIYEADQTHMQPMVSEFYEDFEAAKAAAEATLVDLTGEEAHQTSIGSRRQASVSEAAHDYSIPRLVEGPEACDRCDGQGEEVCPSCATGYARCERWGRCKGTGLIPCRRCEGTGRDPVTGSRKSRRKQALSAVPVTHDQLSTFQGMLSEAGYRISDDEAHDILVLNGGYEAALERAGARTDRMNDARWGEDDDIRDISWGLSELVETTDPTNVFYYGGAMYGPTREDAARIAPLLRQAHWREQVQRFADEGRTYDAEWQDPR